jgi:hypothetical protein
MRYAGSFRARLAALALGAGVFAAAGLPAFAQSLVCTDLQTQYLSLFRTTGIAPNSGQRMLQMDRLSRDYAAAQAAARQANCNRFLFFGPKPSPQCPQIRATVEQLRQQIAQMRQRSFVSFSPEEERDRLRRWLMNYGCEIPEPGGQRTLCVRTCDGYYFPISFSTSRKSFEKDSAVCQSMYAADGQAELFFQSYGRDVADARSLTDQRYGDQPYAFLFRQSFFPVCQNQLKSGIVALGERYWSVVPPPQRQIAQMAVGLSQPPRPTMPLPTLRPTDRQEDPETVANRAGKLPVAPYVPGSDPAGLMMASNGIRMVGEAYYVELFDPGRPAPPEPVHRPPLGFDLIGTAMAAETSGASLADKDPTTTSEIR